jgi:CRP-like cAMP-binding protein
MDTVELLKGVDIFEGLTEQELRRIAGLCREAKYAKGQVVTSQGEEGDEMFIVRDGLVEVTVGEAGEGPRTVVNLGTGQVVGEMALVDRGPRSATVRCVTEATLNVLQRDAFERLCQSNAQIGMVVYRNLAADLSFKLRHRHLSRR